MTLWETRDLPLLQAAATPADPQVREGNFDVGHGHGAAALGVEMTDEDIYDGLLALRDYDYLRFQDHYETGGGVWITDFSVTGTGMQAIGAWPSFERMVSPLTLAAFLERLADEAPTDEEASAARAAADYVRGLAPNVLRAVATGVASTVLRGAIGL